MEHDTVDEGKSHGMPTTSPRSGHSRPPANQLVRAALASMIDPDGDPDEVLEPLDLYEAGIRHLVSQGHCYDDARVRVSRMSDDELRELLAGCAPATRTASAR